jgi:nitrate/TMAO reductase-like tetraheme cytochrome c subunit
MKVRLLNVLIALVVVLAFMGVAMAQDAAKPEAAKHQFVGVKACKTCHKKDGIADSWAATAHATAWDKLSDADKANEALKPFYTTGSTAEGELLTGIQCESCHGAGSDYKKMSVMKDKAAAVAAGMVVPDAKTCANCHNEKAPGKLGATAKDFDFAKMKEKGAHAAAVKATATE